MWLKKFKIALLTEEIETISSLIDEMPLFESRDEIEEAAFLIMQCQSLIEAKKNETSRLMKQIKQTKEFLDSSKTSPSHTLNLKL